MLVESLKYYKSLFKYLNSINGLDDDISISLLISL